MDEQMIARRIVEITRTGDTLAAQLGCIFVVDKRKVRDFRAQAAALRSHAQPK